MMKDKIGLDKIYTEEDLFPRDITLHEEREYGYLFYNEENKDSYDSNHALIYRDKISDVQNVINEIKDFYSKKGINPCIYQAVSEEGFFEEISDELKRNGFEYWTETQKYMVLCEANMLKTNPEIVVEQLDEWKDEYGVEIFEKSGGTLGN